MARSGEVLGGHDLDRLREQAAQRPQLGHGAVRGERPRPVRRQRRDVVLDQPDIGQLLRAPAGRSRCCRRWRRRAPATPRPPSFAGDDRGDVGVLAARLAAGERRTPGRAGRRAAASSRRPWPAPPRRSRCAARGRRRRRRAAPGRRRAAAWPRWAGRYCSRASPSPTSGATHGTAAQLPPSSTKVALPWTRSRSPALLPSCLMPRTPFSVAPSSVANADALRPFQDAKSTSWVSFELGVVVDDAPRLAVGGRRAAGRCRCGGSSRPR